ncbi:Acetyltransferase (GNAT) domain-containing protein [Microbacterium sp. ru370.1]|uniref:GNAT family N-acetyltransferase n=1 Tax=unclassified Microbacterium TaxID=2609290 RepID=UPI000883B2FB|nr:MULTISPECIES: GNAT family N-acetyltransferase [unclassified Microbacterium]SDO96975.1 Acetyltransferase (GNAT) domain-containing protein [Microbacterium sp. ru370.1]SIT92820.1 Acetyltransferase (GNAT) domain-containing protein [Microbacterium sp. RU1D]
MHDLRLEPLAPSLDDYLELRRASGLTPKRPDQGAPALANSWAWRRIVDADGRSVAMGRVVGDGGWYFLVADMATLPSHQRRGLGRRILEDLLAEIRERAPEGAYVTLLADPPGQALYRSLGFTEPTNGSVTMHKLLG